LEWEEQPACNRLLERLDIATSIISFHEQVQGSLAYLKRARKAEQIVVAYAKLETIWRWFLRPQRTQSQEIARVSAEILNGPAEDVLAPRAVSWFFLAHSSLLHQNLKIHR
jgi:hypothetical protein